MCGRTKTQEFGRGFEVVSWRGSLGLGLWVGFREVRG